MSKLLLRVGADLVAIDVADTAGDFPAGAVILNDHKAYPWAVNRYGRPIWRTDWWGTNEVNHQGFTRVDAYDPPEWRGTSTGGNSEYRLWDTTKNWTYDSLHGSYQQFSVQIVAGTGAGQVRSLNSSPSNEETGLYLSWGGGWTDLGGVIPDETSQYRILGESPFGWYIDCEGPPGSRAKWLDVPPDSNRYHDYYTQHYIQRGTWDPLLDRFHWWVRMPGSIDQPDTWIMNWGNYIRSPYNADEGTQGIHCYHYAMDRICADQWIHVVYKRKPAHVVTRPERNWPSNLQHLTGYLGTGVLEHGGNVVATNGSATLSVPGIATNVWYTSMRTELVAPGGKPIYLPRSWPQAEFYEVVAISEDRSSVLLDRPVTLPTATYDLFITEQLPFVLNPAVEWPTVQYFDGLTWWYNRIYANVDEIPARLAMWDWPYCDWGPIYMTRSNGNEPDEIIADMTCQYTGSGYYLTAGTTGGTFTVYHGTSNLANSDGTYNGQGSSAGTLRMGATYHNLSFTTPDMSKQGMYYFFIHCAETGTGSQLEMPALPPGVVG